MNSHISEFICCICGEEIHQDRVEALIELNLPIKTCLKCAEKYNSTYKGIWSGETGTSHLILASGVYNHSVQQIFNQGTDYGFDKM